MHCAPILCDLDFPTLEQFFDCLKLMFLFSKMNSSAVSKSDFEIKIVEKYIDFDKNMSKTLEFLFSCIFKLLVINFALSRINASCQVKKPT